MPNTYTKIFIQVVFAVKFRESLIHSSFREELHKYITGIIENKGQKLIAIFCMPDHVHILVALKGDMSLSDLVRDIKANSSRFINEKGYVKGQFRWQEGFGAFSYSESDVSKVRNYILNQEQHHVIRSFRQEYIDLLEEFEIEYDEKYLFDWLD
jgi:putative transposase